MAKWRGQVADIEIEQDDTQLTIGIIDDPEIAVVDEVSKLRGAGPTTWQDLMRTSREVEVSGTVMDWDLDTWKSLVGYDEAEDALEKDADVPTWTTTVIYEDADGNEAVFPVVECHTENLPLGGSRDEWIGMDLDFTGKTIEGVDEESSV